MRVHTYNFCEYKTATAINKNTGTSNIIILKSILSGEQQVIAWILLLQKY